MNIKLPSEFMGKPIKGSIERVLAAAQVGQGQPDPNVGSPKPNTNPPTPTSAVNDPQNYIMLPGATHGSYSYTDTLVAMDKSHLGKNWYDAHKALAAEGAYMLTIRQFVDFLSLLKSGRAFDGMGSQVLKPRLDEILDEILTIKDPWRAEWLDAKFESLEGVIGIGSKMHIHYAHSVDNAGNINPAKTEQLEPYLESDKTPGIAIPDWLSDATIHGLPKPTVADGSLYYWYPRSGYVAWFGADSNWAVLNCDRDPSFTFARLGVRAARAKN